MKAFFTVLMVIGCAVAMAQPDIPAPTPAPTRVVDVPDQPAPLPATTTPPAAVPTSGGVIPAVDAVSGGNLPPAETAEQRAERLQRQLDLAKIQMGVSRAEIARLQKERDEALALAAKGAATASVVDSKSTPAHRVSRSRTRTSGYEVIRTAPAKPADCGFVTSFITGVRTQLAGLWTQVGSLWSCWRKDHDRLDVLAGKVAVLEGKNPTAATPALQSTQSPEATPAPTSASAITPASAPAMAFATVNISACDQQARDDADKAAADAAEALRIANAQAETVSDLCEYTSSATAYEAAQDAAIKAVANEQATDRDWIRGIVPRVVGCFFLALAALFAVWSHWFTGRHRVCPICGGAGCPCCPDQRAAFAALLAPPAES